MMNVQRSATVFVRSVGLCSLVALGACSEAASPSNDQGTGGSGISGGSGGRPGSGGTVSTGGTISTGGVTSTGGVVSTGGKASTGGVSSGGAPSSGGTTSTGGVVSTGGKSTSAGGSSGAAGAPAGGAAMMGGSGGGAGAGGASTAGAAGSADGGGAPSTRSPGCGKSSTRPNPRTQQTMEHNGATRYYLLDVPANADKDTPLALVFGLHGYDMNNVAVIDLFNFTSRSNGKAITVLPQGEGPPPGDVSHWGDRVLLSTWMAGETNYTYIRNLMLDIQDRFCVDPSRVFIAGFSMGGFFTNSLACAHPEWFRGFSPIAGGGPGSCSNAAAKPPIMIHHGTADDIVEFKSGEGSRDFWVENNECSQMTTSSFMDCQSYSGCATNSPVIWCVGNYNHTITSTTSANIWSFFDGLK